jgi:IS4 transposase
MTNLPFEISGKEIENLYFKRWEIEKKYHTLKNKMKFESITGKATLYIYQDFWAQIVVYNMIQDVLNALNEKMTEEAKSQKYKYPIRINENIAIGLLCSFLALIYGNNILFNKNHQ